MRALIPASDSSATAARGSGTARNAVPMPAGIGARTSGQSEEMQDSFDSMLFTLALAIFLVYLVMASQFESLRHPLVILFSVPFSVIGAVVISLVILLMTRFDWYARPMSNQILRVQIPDGTPFDTLFDRAFVRYTSSSELISADSVNGGTVTELTYSIGMKKSNQIQDFLTELRNLNGDNKVTLIAGYNGTDL